MRIAIEKKDLVQLIEAAELEFEDNGKTIIVSGFQNRGDVQIVEYDIENNGE